MHRVEVFTPPTVGAILGEARIPWRALIYSLLSAFVVWYAGTALQTAEAAIAQRNVFEASLPSAQLKLEQVREVKSDWIGLLPKLDQIDRTLPGLATNELDVLSEQLNSALVAGDFDGAGGVVDEMGQLAGEILAHQDEIIQAEIVRLRDGLSSNLVELKNILGDPGVVPADAVAQLDDQSIQPQHRLAMGREWMDKTANEVKSRRAEMDEAQKQIVIRKSTLQLSMYENGREIKSMPVSLGRPGYGTRSGDFAILDKLGTVWGIWRIWLPQWMGIYYAGASENGIHGLPYDNTGNVYWAAQVGKQNITYGCVMPDDEDMAALYAWAEVGVPVAIVQ